MTGLPATASHVTLHLNSAAQWIDCNNKHVLPKFPEKEKTNTFTTEPYGFVLTELDPLRNASTVLLPFFPSSINVHLNSPASDEVNLFSATSMQSSNHLLQILR